MADGIHANYAKIGLTVVLGVAAVIGTLIYCGGLGSHSSELYAETYYDNAVSGLAVGSDVNLRGVKIGEVREINFIGNKYDCAEGDVQKIYLRFAFDPKLFQLADGESFTPMECLEMLVKRGLRATVSASGITGLSHVELNFPRVPGAAAKEPALSWQPRTLFIPPEPSMLDSFADAAAKFMNQVNHMDFMTAWSNLASTAASAAKVAGDVRELIESERFGIANIVRNLDETAALLKEFSAEVKENPSLLLRENDPEPLPETAP